MARKTRIFTVALCALALAAGLLPARAGDVEDARALVASLARATPYADLLERVLGPAAGALPLPADPARALIDATAALSAAAGIPQDAAAAIRAASLPDEIAGRLANVERALLACAEVTGRALAGLTEQQLAAAIEGEPLGAARFDAIPACAIRLWRAAGDLERTLLDSSGAISLDVWPVVKIDDSTDTLYRNDYMLIVDLSGADTYMNNAGSNMIDLNYAPPGSPVPGLRGYGPAAGCQQALAGFANGECSPLASLLLDLAGDDAYGVKEPPELDATCTADPVMRRQVTGGVGFAGVGILIDSVGNDRYTGKTVAIGAGHVYGVGILDDRAGNDTYAAVRNSEGFALVGGLGLLRDEAGDDSYDYYMPSPLTPGAPNQTPGAGGVIDDENQCDAKPRFTQGAGNVSGAVGILHEESGDDTYHGAYTDTFLAPAGGLTAGRGGAQGFANNESIGVLFDRSGTDGYAIDGDQGAPARANSSVILPDPNCQSSTCSGGVFVDE